MGLPEKGPLDEWGFAVMCFEFKRPTKDRKAQHSGWWEQHARVRARTGGHFGHGGLDAEGRGRGEGVPGLRPVSPNRHPPCA